MKGYPQLITVENFKFSIFDSVPKPDADTAYILYKEGGKPEQILVITNQRPVLSAQIRAGKYNKKGIMSLAVRETEVNREVADETGKFKFFLYTKVGYRVKDAGYVFIHKIDIDTMVYNTVYEILDGIHRKYQIDDQMDLEDGIKKQLRDSLKALDYLDIFEPEIRVDVDERAREIIDSNLNTMAKSMVRQNQEDITSLEIEQRKRLETQRYEAEREVQEKINDLTLEKIKGFNTAKQEAGEDYSLVLAYINGEINSVELDEKLRDNKNDDLEKKIKALKQLVSLDPEVLSGVLLEKAILKLLGENTASVESGQQNTLIEDTSKADEIIVEDSEEY